MKIEVKLFAGMAESTGKSTLTLELAAGATVADAMGLLRSRITRRWPEGMLAAVNLAYVPAQTVLHEGDVLALIPPVSGG